MKFRFQLSWLLWLVAVAAAFLAGTQVTRKPVVVAAKDLSHRSMKSRADFTVVYRADREIPDDAIVDISSIDGRTLSRPICRDAIITAADLADPLTEVPSISLPLGYRVVNVEISNNDPLVYFTLDAGDRVKLVAVDPDGNEAVLDDFARVFNVGSAFIDQSLVGLLVSYEVFDTIIASRQSKIRLLLKPPDPKAE